MTPSAKVFATLAALFAISAILLFGWSGCESMLEPRIYRGDNTPADVVIFGHAYPPQSVPLHIRLLHGYGWIPLLLLAYGSFKIVDRLDTASKSKGQAHEQSTPNP
jgi:hypothetical protein